MDGSQTVLVVVGVALFDFGQRSEAFGSLGQRLLEARGVFLGLFDLLVHFLDRGLIAFLLGEVAELRIHFGVFVGLAGDGGLEVVRGGADRQAGRRISRPRRERAIFCTVTPLMRASGCARLTRSIISL